MTTIHTSELIETREAYTARLARELRVELAERNGEPSPGRTMADVVTDLRQKMGAHDVLDHIFGHGRLTADDQAEVERLRKMAAELIGRPSVETPDPGDDRPLSGHVVEADEDDASAIRRLSKAAKARR